MFISFLIFFSFSSLSQDNQSDKADRPPVIAVGGFANNFGYSQESAHALLALRDRVVSDLVRNYDCIVLSRSKGYDMAMEKAINTISMIDKKNMPDAIPAVDYALTGYFEGGARAEANRVHVDFVLVATNPAEKSRSDFKIVRMNDESLWPIDQKSGKISERIAKELKLKKRPDKKVKEGKIDEVWAVLPFSRLEKAKSLKMPPDSDLAIKVELALQESNRLKTIVDHKDIDRTLIEMKISSLSGATEGFVGGLAMIIGADKIIMGTVSSSYQKGNDLRVDILLVDGKNSVVIDSRSALCNKETLDRTVSAEALEFLKHVYVSVPLENSTLEMRKKEAQLYLDVGKAIKIRTNSYDSEMILNSIGFFDSAYYLACGDDETLYKTAEKMTGIMGHKKFAGQFPEIVNELGRKVEEMLVNINPSEKCPLPFIQRAKVKIILGRYEEALKLAEEQIENNPKADNPESNAPVPFSMVMVMMVKADAYMGLKEYDKAVKCLEKLPPVNFITAKRIDVCKLKGDEKKELEYLKQLNMGGYDLTEYPMRLFALMKKLEGAANAIKYADTNFSSWIVNRPEYQIELVKACIESGDKKRAATLIDILSSKNIFEKIKKESKERAAEITELKKQLGDVTGIEWKTAARVKKIPEEYKIYFQPVGDMDMKSLEEAAKSLSGYFGIKTVVLPVLPMPQDPDCFKKDRGQYDAKALAERVAMSTELPSDALFIAYFTKESIYQDDLRFVYGSYYSEYGGSVISYHMINYGNMKISDVLAKTAASMLVSRYMQNKCKSFSCISVSSGKMDGNADKQLALCETCQKNYAKLDFNKLYDGLQNKYIPLVRENVRNKINSDKEIRKWVDDYNRKVKSALEKQK